MDKWKSKDNGDLLSMTKYRNKWRCCCVKLSFPLRFKSHGVKLSKSKSKNTLSNIISTFSNITYHIYAYNIELLITIPFKSLNSKLELLECASEIINWLLRNDLLVNTSKTELFM